MLDIDNILNGKKFLWGSATASYQCEGAYNVGNKLEGEWDFFNHHSPLNINNEDGDESCDFFHRYKEDIDLMAEGNQNTFRFSLSWSRIMASVDGEVNPEGIDFYNNVIDYCLQKGLEPNVTIYHYDFPLELAKKGGWLNLDIAKYFKIYAMVCFEHFGDRVKLWSTINEPRYYAYCSNIVGNYPPNRKLDFQSYFQSIYNMMIASSLAVSEFRKMNLEGIIGIVHDSGGVEIDEESVDPEFVDKVAKLFFHNIVLDPTLLGIVPTGIDELIDLFKITLLRDENEDEIFKNGVVDYVGMNLYARRYVKNYTSGESEVFHNNTGTGTSPREGLRIKGLFETSFDMTSKRNKWGREIEPQAMYNAIMYIKEEYNNPLIFITENGHGALETPDENSYVADDERIEILDGFISKMLQAKSDGARVYGYYHWSTMDLYSWINGYNKRYGLVRIDFDNENQRTPKKSYYWYKDFIAKHLQDN